MNYPIPDNLEDIEALKQNPVDDALVAAAIAGVVSIARSQGQSLEDLTAEVLADDRLLDPNVRRMLSEIVIQAWESLP
jgi:hypothetical protein